MYLAAILFIFLQTCSVYTQDILKGSLTFVIDDTGSMSEEIDQVKESVNKIFDTVLSTKESQVENFILVTFNDPDYYLLKDTKDRDEFKKALASIIVDGGGLCPEYSMSGIKLALESSLPHSLLYVYTDASSADYNMFEEVRNLAQKKQIQVTFLLTGDCGSRSGIDYEVYNSLADATSGDVYNMMKSDIADIINLIIENIKGRDGLLASGTFPPGCCHKVNYTSDCKNSEVYISVTGKDPKIKLIDDAGKPIETEDIVKKAEIAVKKVIDPKPGKYTAEVGSDTITVAKVRAKTTIIIEARFSGFEPTSPKDTASSPAPEGNTYLSVQLYGEGVVLEDATIYDMKGNVVKRLALRMVDKTIKFYVAEPFDPPRMFRVSVSGYDDEGKCLIKRAVTTPIERQTMEFETPLDTAPTVTIEGAPEMITEYGVPFRLKCNVRAFPKPEIKWIEKDTGSILEATVSTKELPYDYISILNIEAMKKNSTYECTATNSIGGNLDYINVAMSTYFNVLETPEARLHVNYGEETQLVCKVDANPPATITWSKDGKPLASDIHNILISSDNATVTIKYVDLEAQGKYSCGARNDIERKIFSSTLDVFGLKEPKIDKSEDAIYVSEGEVSKIICRVIQGVPPPTIQWYFQRKGTYEFKLLKETSEVLQVEYVTSEDIGTYKCVATNVMGTEQYAVFLLINPPTIKNDEEPQFILAEDGKELRIPCEADGFPKPLVTWSRKEFELHDNNDTLIMADHSLRIRKVKLSDKGVYTCEAINEHGSAEKKVYVDVFVPVNIYTPNITTFATLVGRDLLLRCDADGYPRPQIKWVYNDFHGKWAPRPIRPGVRAEALSLRRLQLSDEGYYTCLASNVGGSSNLTYAVQVNAPPLIEKPGKSFKAVNGDLVLRIECKVTGRPKPTVVWMKDDLNIAFGTDWYDIENGTLLIKNIDESSAGDYVCSAENEFGSDSVNYEVEVQEYPTRNVYTHVTDKFIEIDKSTHIPCDIPHKEVDLLRWYKNGELIHIGELTLHDASLEYEGLYSCRVSNMSKSSSAHVNVIVEYKPYFIDEDEPFIAFVRGDSVDLSCDAEGKPAPTVTWKLNNKNIEVTEMNYELIMQLDNRGTYTCEVKNSRGSIQRSFTILSEDECILDTKKYLTGANRPIMTTTSLTWTLFTVADNYMIINRDEPFYLHCPKGFRNIMFPSQKTLMAFCENETKVKISGHILDYSEIQCNEEAELDVRENERRCLSGNTKSLQIGYDLHAGFLKVFDVCLDKNNNVPLYTQHELSAYQYNDTQDTIEWSNSDYMPFDFDTMYDCYNQVNDISATLDKEFHLYDSCCFDRRQLVNQKDLRPGVPLAAAYTYLNVVPHWSTCNSKNWADVEQRVRKLATNFRKPLTISTGTAKPLKMGDRSDPKDINLIDSRGRKQPVAEYLWKVVLDKELSRGLAIIQVNVPDLKAEDAASYVHCRDICGAINWMRGTDWHDVKNGYTFCCSIQEFQSKFHFFNEFSSRATRILRDVFYIPKYY